MNNRNIDWSNNCDFDDNGKLLGFKVPSSSNHWGMKPIPKSEKLTKDAEDADKLLTSIMQPATGEQIGIVIKKLSLHCGIQAKTPDEIKYLFLDYRNDLAKYPIALITEACDNYRELPEGNDFLPSSGKLIDMMSDKFSKMEYFRGKIDQILGKYVVKQSRENKSISIMEALNNLNIG